MVYIILFICKLKKKLVLYPELNSQMFSIKLYSGVRKVGGGMPTDDMPLCGSPLSQKLQEKHKGIEMVSKGIVFL